MRGMRGKWQSYKHRFTPWLALNWSSRQYVWSWLVTQCQVKRSDARQNAAQEKTALTQLSSLLRQLDSALPRLSVREVRQLLQSEKELRLLHERGREVVREEFGFCVEVCASRLEGGGRGVVVTEGRVPSGHLVGLYPGTVYMPQEPLFFQSLRNPFVFRCIDGVMIDGNHRGLSKWIYKSCAYRDVVGGHSMASDVTWLSMLPCNPLAVGQFVNNHTREVASNVEYTELTISRHQFPHHHWRLIPNVYNSSITPGYQCDSAASSMRCVGLMSTTDIEPGTELYSSYITLVHTADPNS